MITATLRSERNLTRNWLLVAIGLVLAFPFAPDCRAQEAGIFYSTLYAKTMEPQRLSHFAGDATAWYWEDVNGDGLDDAVAYFGHGERAGQWWAALSNGKAFGVPKRLRQESAPAGEQHDLTGDVNGDGALDMISFDKSMGNWSVALAKNGRFEKPAEWRQDFGRDADFGFVCDVDGDGRDDIGYHDDSTWYVSYSCGEGFGDYRHRWITGLGQHDFVRGRNKQNPPPVVAYLTGSIDGQCGWACIVDAWGRWFAVSNPERKTTLNLATQNTYVAWRCSYLPQIPGHEGTYDSGNPAVHDTQIKMLDDAGFTFVTMDITNGHHQWVDSRAHRFFESVRRWNREREPGQHKIHVNIALGRTRGVEGEEAFFEKLNLECKRAWHEFYLPYQDVYYQLDGKPLVIHMISNGLRDGYYKRLEQWNGEREYIDKVTCRWMTGWGGCTEQRANFFGWDVRDKFGNPYHPEMMPVMPGFWNGGNFVHREGGDFYRSQWMRVLKHQPKSVWVNSLNETWEHTSVEPAYMFNDREPHDGITLWTDAYGQRMDDFYWVMTRQYMKLFMENALYEGTYFQEYIRDGHYGHIYKAMPQGFIRQDAVPRQAPVLLLPPNFKKDFAGKIITGQSDWQQALMAK